MYDFHVNKVDFDTSKVQKYVNFKEIDLLGGQNHFLCYNIRNMVLVWPILHQSRVQNSYVGLENNLDDSHGKNSLILTPGRCKIRQI